MKKIAFLCAVAFASIFFIGCSSEPAADDYGGEVKDSGGAPLPPGKSGAAEVPADR